MNPYFCPRKYKSKHLWDFTDALTYIVYTIVKMSGFYLYSYKPSSAHSGKRWPINTHTTINFTVCKIFFLRLTVVLSSLNPIACIFIIYEKVFPKVLHDRKIRGVFLKGYHYTINFVGLRGPTSSGSVKHLGITYK